MKRKVGKVGLSSLTITLPVDFVKKNGINQGDSINLIVKDKTLVINLDEELINEDSICNLDCSELDDTLIWRYILGAYKKGFKLIKINFKKEMVKTKGRLKRKNVEEINIFNLIEEISKLLIGIEIVSKSNNEIILREVAEVKDKEFFLSFKRITYLLKEMVYNITVYIKDKNQTAKNNIESLDKEINKLALYCQRISQYSLKYNIFEFVSIVNYLEQIGDHLKEFPILLDKVNIENKSESIILSTIEIVEKNLELISVGITGADKNLINDYFENCDIIQEQSKNAEILSTQFANIREMLREIGQTMIEAKFTS